jgi:hypothetical protein
MGTMSFLLPPTVSAGTNRDLQLACLAGGFDNAPHPTQVQIQGNRISLTRAVEESGFLIIPWQIEGAGNVMASTTTLLERPEPYSLAVELARGKVNQIRNHIAECGPLGIQFTDEQLGRVSQLNHRFGQVLASHPSSQSDQMAQEVLAEAFALSDELLPRYAQELFRIRHQRIPRLDAILGSQISKLPPSTDQLAPSFNGIRLAFSWQSVEPTESQYDWEAPDAALDWAEANQLNVAAGPLIDLSATGLPKWLWIWQNDLPNLANFMCDYVETVINRYRRRISRWYIATGCNISGPLGLSEDDILWLTARLVEAALQIAPEMEIILGVSQPFGDYMAREEHTYTPLVFLDTLLRTGLKLSAIDVELILGIRPVGSYCRDLLEVSRVLDSYAVLGAPVQVTLCMPSGSGADSAAEPGLTVGLGEWQGGFDQANQAKKGRQIVEVALSKPFVTGVYWSHLSDGLPHRFPNCGLLDADHRPKLILEEVGQVRQMHLH